MTTEKLDHYQYLLCDCYSYATSWTEEKERMKAIVSFARKNQEITADELKTLRAWVSRRIEEHRF